MQLSQAVADRGDRLTLEEFLAAFRTAWAGLRSRFLKLETWQSYRELTTNRSQKAYLHGDRDRASKLLREEAEGDRPLYEDITHRGLDYSRIRLIKQPVSDYLRYELMSYQIRAQMGERIVVVEMDPAVPLPNDKTFDVLLFDRDTALVHDYGTGDVGHQIGGWLVRERELVETLEEQTLALRRRAIPLEQYLANTPIT